MTKYSRIWANGRRNLTKLFIGSLRASWAFKNQIVNAPVFDRCALPASFCAAAVIREGLHRTVLVASYPNFPPDFSFKVKTSKLRFRQKYSRLRCLLLLTLAKTEIIYSTRAIITRSRFETALIYKPRILGLKNEEFPFLVHKLSVI